MASFNKVILVGNLTRDPEVRYLASGTALCEIGLAVNEKWKDKASGDMKEKVTFIDITLWGRTAEIAGEYLAKGKSVMIEGKLDLDTWDDKETGKKRQKLKVTGQNLVMLGGRSDSTGGQKEESSRPSSGGVSADTSSAQADPWAEDVPF